MKYLIIVFLLSACDLKQQYITHGKHLIYQDVCPFSEIVIGMEMDTGGIWCAKIEILNPQ